MRGQPAFKPLRRAQAAVQGHHALQPQMGKTLFESGLQLWSQVDLWHHDQDLCRRILGQYVCGSAQINLGFTAACGAKQQGWTPFFRIFCIKIGQSPILLATKCY